MAMSERVKFNVIIPTRERADTLYHCLRTVIAQEYDNLDIIVSDNFSQDSTREVVASLSDPRLKYINTGKRISMSHNWEFALNHVMDGWVSFLGDDDGMLPNSLIFLSECINKYPIEAITPKFGRYLWPNFCGSDSPEMTVPLGNGVQIKPCREMLAKVMRGRANYYELPWLYLGGFAKIEAINRAKSEGGRFFLSCTPDVYSAIALSSVTEQYLLIEKPIAINGVSKHSTGASYTTSIHGAPIKKFLSEANIPYHPSLVLDMAKSIPMLVYESYLQAAHLHKNKLGIKIQDQLVIALAAASEENYIPLATDCKKTCEINEIDFHAVQKKGKKLRFISRIRSLAQRIYKLVIKNDFSINIDASFIKDINAAAVVSYCVRQLSENNLLKNIPFVGRLLFLMRYK